MTTPVITWTQPAPITYPTALGTAQLDATANVPGTFVYTPAAGVVLPAGTQTLSAVFTPADTANYSTATASVTLAVNAAASNPASDSNCTSGQATNAAAFVYVSTGQNGGSDNQLEGFSAAADGSLTPIPESPFVTQGLLPLSTTGTGSILFGDDGYTIYSFNVTPGGCFNLENSFVAGQGPENNPYFLLGYLFLDPEGANLYSFAYDGQESNYTTYSFNAGTGQLTPVGATQTNVLDDAGIIAFASNDQYAVTSDSYVREGPVISEYQRSSDGALTPFAQGPLPTAASGNWYAPYGAAADGSNHFVIAVTPCPVDDEGACGTPSGPMQLAVYTIDDSGTLTTTSTWQNMPSVAIRPLGFYQFSPDSRYLAVSGFSGLQVFAWDSANMTLTSIGTVNNSEGSCNSSGYCTGSGFGNLAWDQNDHLYTYLGQQLFVYAVSSSGIATAPGSPYSIPNPSWVTVISPEAN